MYPVHHHSDKISLKTRFCGIRYTSNNFVQVIIFWEMQESSSSHNILKHIIFCTFLYLQCHLIAWFNVVWLHYIEQKITLSDLFNSWSLMCIQLVENFEIANWNFLREYILMDPNSISERLTDCYLCMTLYFISNCSILVHGFISDKTKYLNESRWSQSISSLNQTHAKEQWNSLV